MFSRYAWLSGLALSAVGLLLLTSQAQANGRVVSYERQVAGPYEIALGTIPGSPGIGRLHLTMTVADASSGALMMDAWVRVTGAGPDESEIEIGPVDAITNPRDPSFYDVTTTVDREGTWTFTVLVSGTLGAGTADYFIDVRNPSPVIGIATLLTLMAFLIIIGLAVKAAMSQERRRRGPRQRRRR